jgi:hypothetical protein
MTDDVQKNLNDKFQTAASKGRAAEVLSLLESGADINSVDDNKRTALMHAARQGYLEAVEILLEAGADKTLRDISNDTAEYDARAKGHKDIETLLRDYVRVVETADEVIFQRPLGDRTLQESFNFVTRERISLVRKSPKGAVEAMTCVNFSALEDQSDESMLRKAFNEHVRRGGTADEALVFPNKLLKNKLPRGG